MRYTSVIILLLIFLNHTGFAQCSPTVIFKEDFGTGTNQFGPALNANIISCTYDATGTLADGEYSIRKRANPLDGTQIYPTWFSGFDHTGNDGYMMVINASFNSGKFYEKQIDNLCSGSALQFSAWVANLLKAGSPDPLDPDVKFEIKSVVSGQILGSYTTGKINRHTSFTWEQYAISILLPPGESSVILTMYNNQVGGGGNDLCIDDIEFSICGAEMNPSITGFYQNGNTVCSNQPIVINGNITKQVYINPVMQWQYSSDSINWVNIPGAVQEDYAISNATTADSKWYRLLIAEPSNINSPNCRSASLAIKLAVFDPKPVSIQHKNPFCIGDTIILTNQSAALDYQWLGPNNFSSNADTAIIPQASFNEQGTYLLQTITDGGCITIGSTTVTVIPNQLSVSLPDTTTLLCDNATVTFSADNPFITNWKWSTGEQTKSITVAIDGMYWVKVNDIACAAADTTFVRTNRTPYVNFGKDITICSGEELVLNAAAPVSNSYLWEDNSSDSVLLITNPGYYNVTLTNECGQASDDIAVTVANCLNQLFVPTAFTPNNDNKNDILKARAFFPITDFSFSIYTRWGQQVFSTNILSNGWDGNFGSKEASVGTYVWQLSYKRKGIAYKQKGTTILLR
ncbi:MAG: gliding motility-associated C-terminal domain-containing protein [Sphingobacteriales bacterium]